VIDRYRQTMSLDYYGDSILNSMCDILFAIGGFVLAARFPAGLAIALVILIEVGLALIIRDNLTLNIIMLIHPFQSIKHWQMGGLLAGIHPFGSLWPIKIIGPWNSAPIR